MNKLVMLIAHRIALDPTNVQPGQARAEIVIGDAADHYDDAEAVQWIADLAAHQC